jgi:hypothetical protein
MAAPVAIAVMCAVAFVGPTAFTGLDPARAGHDILRGAVPYRDFPLEYPPGGALILALAAVLPGSYRFAFRALMVLAWAALAVMVAREADGDRRTTAGFFGVTVALAWIVPAMYDIVVGVAAFAAWRSARRGRTVPAAAWLAAGVVVKWVTLACAPFLLARTRARPVAMAAALLAISLVVAVLLPALVARDGGDPVSFHRGRLVHAESTLGSAIVVVRLARGDDARIVDDHRSAGVAGAGRWAILAGLAAVAALALYVWLRCDPGSAASWGAVLLGITALGPVASPQFLTWVMGLAAFWSARARALFVAAALLSLAYIGFIDKVPVSHPLPAVTVLLRNLVALGTLWTLVAESRRPARAGLQTAPAGADKP